MSHSSNQKLASVALNGTDIELQQLPSFIYKKYCELYAVSNHFTMLQVISTQM